MVSSVCVLRVVALGLERVGDKPWHVCASSAVSGAGLHDGVAWLARQLRELPPAP